MMRLPSRRRLWIALLVAGQILPPTLAYAQLPGMGDGGEMTVSAERNLGDRIARELYRDTDYIDDPVIGDYVQDIWQRLMAAARVRGELTAELDERFAWQVLVGRDRSINAFALPGGYLGLHLGLVAVTSSRDELATVLGHELSHVTQRHIARQMDKQSRQTPWLLAGMILGMLAAAKSKSVDGGQAVMMGTQAYAMQSQLSFSRDVEREADRIGFNVMTQAGFAPQGAASMFEKLQYASRISDNGSYPYLRSHPLTSERISDMQARFQFKADGAMPTQPLALDHALIAGRARVLSRPGVDALRLYIEAADSSDFARGTPPQQAGTLYSAALSASELKDTKAARSFAARLNTRVSGDPAAARIARLLSAEIELAAGNAAGASALIDPKPKDRASLLLASQAAMAGGRAGPTAPAMTAQLRDWVATHPRDGTAWRTLSNLYSAQNDGLRAVRADAEANVAILDYVAARDRFKAAQEMVRQGRGGSAIDHYEASIVDSRAREIDGKVKEQFEEKPLR
ncbi:MAG: M48 family metalloprotease [Variovorax sp.]